MAGNIETTASTGNQRGAEIERTVCVMTANDDCCTCSGEPRQVRCLPCQHQATCELCTVKHFLEEMRRGHQPPWCPWCRAPVNSVDRAEPEKEGSTDPVAATSTSEPPRTRRICTFRPGLPNDTEESVDAFLQRVKSRTITRELRLRRRASMAAAVYEWLGVYCATLVAAFLFLGVVYGMSKLFFFLTDLDGPGIRHIDASGHYVY